MTTSEDVDASRQSRGEMQSVTPRLARAFGVALGEFMPVAPADRNLQRARAETRANKIDGFKFIQSFGDITPRSASSTFAFAVLAFASSAAVSAVAVARARAKSKLERDLPKFTHWRAAYVASKALASSTVVVASASALIACAWTLVGAERGARAIEAARRAIDVEQRRVNSTPERDDGRFKR